MMKNYKIIILLGVIALAAACKKYQTFPIGQETIDRVFDSRDSLGTNANAFLLNIYSDLLDGRNRVNGDFLDAATDDAVSSAASSSNQVTQLSTGFYNSGTFAFGSGDNVWSQCYTGIRAANIFIDNIGVVPVEATIPNNPKLTNVSMKYAWKSEARFLRAYFYFQLVERYGGVPLIGNQVFTVGQDVKLPRNTFADCVNYIVSECDAITDTLLTAPTATSNYGRITNGAAMALKARVLLYAASPLFNGTTLVNDAGNGPGPRDVTNPAIVGYPTADPTRWQAAANAALAVYELNAYSLDNASGTGVDNFQDIFLTQANPEIILAKITDNGNQIETNNAPVGFPGAPADGRTSPTQDLVNAYPMISGLPPTTANGFNPDNPYANRDPRLKYTVFVNGQLWLNTALQLYQGGQSNPNGSAGTNAYKTVSGYYMHKFMGYSETSNVFQTHSEDWVIFRFAEIYLDYAEAENEAVGPNSNDYRALLAIRQRAGISPGSGTFGIQPLGAITQDSLRSAIHNERRLEFAFEEQRFFDIRRWKIAGGANGVMNQNKNGISITNNGGSLSYNPLVILPALFKPNTFTAKEYLEPIPYSEVIGNPQMQQNPGW